MFHVSRPIAVTAADTRRVTDDVSKLSLGTAGASQQESVKSAEREGVKGDSGRIVRLSDSPFSLISIGPF